MSPSRRVRRAAMCHAALAVFLACRTTETAGVGGDTVPVRPTVPPKYRASGHAAAGDVFVHLFDWRWDDIARECETVLGPAGYAAVQVSPPNEHSITPTFDWSERYQPVSYALTRSRSGTRDEFVAMVARCRAVGVGIYVDAVINHMTNFPSPGVGSAGTAYTKYNYPGLYTPADFHTPCGITNYQNAANVQDCELLSLPDLNTGSATVRQKLADYLIALHRLGVAGYRIDAAKHIQQWELDQVVALVNSTAIAEGRATPYWFLEVIGGNGEAVKPTDYLGIGYASGGAADITEFTFVGVGNKFRGVNGERLAQLNPQGGQGNQFSAQAWGMLPSDKAVAFLQNHDTQHDCGLGYRHGMTFRLANVWMLATPYGYPSILSSFAFACPTGNSMGPPSDAAGWTLNVRCATMMEAAVVGEWVCEHRDPYIRNMVRFRKAVVGTDVTQWWDNGANAIAFSRGSKGFVAINREPTPVLVSTATGLPAGTYCDVISGGKVGSACAGATVVVASGGGVSFMLGSNQAVAVESAGRL